MCPAVQKALPLERAGPPPCRAPSAPAGPAAADPAAAADELGVELHDAEEAMPALAPEWTELAACASEANCFAEPWFVAASLATLLVGQTIRIAAVRRGSRLIGVLQLAIGDRYGRTPIRFVRNWWHPHMLLGTPLVRAGEESAFWSALIARLDHAAWAPNLLHIVGLAEGGPVHRGLAAAATGLGRGCPTVHRETRALLEGGVDSRTYYERHVRAKKRKELRRLRHRLDELGTVAARRLERDDELDAWCDAFLALELAGWKGKAGTALASAPETAAFFRAVVAGAWAAGRLHFLRLDLDGRPIAMLVDFVAPPGSFSFKTCFDEDFARFSPGVLIQLENLAILDRGDIAWMDSCAVENHPMIDSLWSGRRTVVRVTVRLRGLRRYLVHAVCRALECGSAALRLRLQGSHG